MSVLVLDQLTKYIVRATLPLQDSINVVPGFIDLTHVQNTGAAFGLLNAADFPYKPAVMIGIAAVALVAIAAYGAQLGFHERMARFGLSLILGGAFGNLIDRAVAGHVDREPHDLEDRGDDLAPPRRPVADAAQRRDRGAGRATGDGRRRGLRTSAQPPIVSSSERATTTRARPPSLAR